MSYTTKRPKPYPDKDILDYEWERTPSKVKDLIEKQKLQLQQKDAEIASLKVQNDWFREQLELDSPQKYRRQPPTVSVPEVILWTLIGLLLTIGATLVPVHTISPPWTWANKGINTQSLGVTCQIGAVLLTGCVGGKFAGAFSQILYLILGLIWLPLFNAGGGFDYTTQSTFGYILGFFAGAAVCGLIAYQKRASLHRLAISCLAGLITIHTAGITYLAIIHYFGIGEKDLSLSQAIVNYSVNPLFGQFVLVCAVTLIAYGLRKLSFT